LVSLGVVGGPVAGAAPSKPLTVLEYSGDWGTWPSLDPATDSSAIANSVYFNAIYGNLFQLESGGKLVGDLATGYKFLDGGRAFEILLRHGVKFQDGTPFNADAVAFNIRRDLNPKNGCLCDPSFPVSSVTVPNQYTVILHLTRVDSAIGYAFFQDAPNWIVSPTALSKLGEKQFELMPVGAGPFSVVSDEPSATLVLKKYKGYWQSGHPYLSSLTFKTVGTDQSGYEALLSGEGQAYQNLTTTSLVATAKQHLRVTTMPSGTGPQAIQLDTSTAPFNNIVAREALYYATDVQPIEKTATSGTGTVTESPSEPGGLYFQATVPGYRTYNLAKAEAAVKQLGGLTFDLGCGMQAEAVQVCESLASEWAAAGIKATIVQQSLQDQVKAFQTRSWQAVLGAIGGFDPVLVTGYPLRFESSGLFSGVHDQKLDALIAQASASLSSSVETATEDKIFQYISDQAYAPLLFVTPLINLTEPSVSGPGLSTSGYQTEWQNVKVDQ
jgi:peptide/nickel transport system substrate-binding protein